MNISLKYFVYSLRPQQWIKNMFVFLPALFGQVLLSVDILIAASLGFVVFCFASSAVYLVNDVLDYDRDQLHPSKKLRPIAAGHIKRNHALGIAIILAFASCLGGASINLVFGGTIFLYISFNFVYSFFLKSIVIIDVFCIGLFFMLRLMAGSILAGVALSHWIIIMTVLLALFLGFNKRRQELKWLKIKAGHHRSVLKKYNQYFIDQMISVVTSSIMVTYMLYTVDITTIENIGSRKLICTIPFVYYGIFRYLYLIHIRNIDGDPTRVVIKDRLTLLNLLLWFIVSGMVIYLGE